MWTNLPTPVHEIDSSPPDSIEDKDDDEYEDEQPPLTSHQSLLTSHALSLLAQIG